MRKIALFILFGIICSSLQVHSQNNTVPGFKLVWQKASAETGAIANKLYYSEVFTHVVNDLNAMFALPWTSTSCSLRVMKEPLQFGNGVSRRDHSL
ncbi:MAG: hypothetical protein H6561_12800 [Lewinellaceae bacterium]|nr:hypothetical protein [Lewinellaceae bacterium]